MHPIAFSFVAMLECDATQQKVLSANILYSKWEKTSVYSQARAR